jgi:Flp pilus assembly pilin Flp
MGIQIREVTRRGNTAMNSFRNRLTLGLKRLGKDESGQDLVEYALLVAMIAVAVAATFPSTIAPSISSIFSRIQSGFTATHNFGS